MNTVETESKRELKHGIVTKQDPNGNMLENLCCIDLMGTAIIKYKWLSHNLFNAYPVIISSSYIEKIETASCKNQELNIFYISKDDQDTVVYCDYELGDVVERITRDRAEPNMREMFRDALVMMYEYLKELGLVKRYEAVDWEWES